MRYIEHDDAYELSTGKLFHAHGGVLGLGHRPPFPSFDGGKPGFYHGWDGGQEGGHLLPSGEYAEFTSEERQEIARYMIEVWAKWGELGPLASWGINWSRGQEGAAPADQSKDQGT